MKPDYLGLDKLFPSCCFQENFFVCRQSDISDAYEISDCLHPQKNHNWKHRRYFTTVGLLSRWNFFAIGKDRQGKAKAHFLFKAASMPIKRHVKIRKEANPFLPEFAQYSLKWGEKSKSK
jgi:hypothetical protein